MKFQACRGDKLDEGINFERVNPFHVLSKVPSVESKKIPLQADFLIVYSTPPGYYAFRNIFDGSYLIRFLVEELEKNHKMHKIDAENKLDFLSLLTNVNRRICYEFESKSSRPEFDGKKQTICFTSMLTRQIYLTPKD